MKSPIGLAVVATAMTLAVSAAVMWARPDLTRGAAFLFADQAANLFVAHQLHQGAALFTDVAFPYGPVSIEFYAALSGWLGNTPLVYLGTMAALAALSAGMVVWQIGRVVDHRIAFATIALGIAVTMPLPGANIGGFTSSIYMPIERLCLLGAALLWVSPLERRLRTSVAIGLVLGFCQGVRFGSGAVGVAAVVLVDLAASAPGAAWKSVRVVRSIAAVVTGFLVSECAWVVWAFATLPAPFAWELLWPLQMWETHQSNGLARWPIWGGWKMAATAYGLPVTALCLASVGFWRWGTRSAATRTRGRDAEGGAFVLLTFFVLASLTYFRHEHHFRQFAWMLIPGAAMALAESARRTRWLALVLCAPAIWPLVSLLAHRPPADTVSVTVPRGFTLFVPPATATQLAFLGAIERTGPVLFMPNGAGWLYAYDVPYVTRHTWFYSSAVVRPFEYESFATGAAAAALVIMCPARSDDMAWPLPESIVASLEPHFVPAEGDNGCHIWKPRSASR